MLEGLILPSTHFSKGYAILFCFILATGERCSPVTMVSDQMEDLKGVIILHKKKCKRCSV